MSFSDSGSNNVKFSSLSLCKEVLDGIRIYFDFALNDHLLYEEEKNYIETSPAKASPIPPRKVENHVKTEDEYAHLPIVDDDDSSFQSDVDGVALSPIRSARRRTLRSNKSNDSTSNGFGQSYEAYRNHTGSTGNELNGTSVKIPVWKALPEEVYVQIPQPPCLVYGATHLLRLFGEVHLFNCY